MIKPKDVLKVARWTYPNMVWSLTMDGDVVGRINPEHKPLRFELNHGRDLQSVTMKLQQDHGWKVTQVTRSGHPHWKADNGKGGTAESPSLQKLLVVLVDRVSGEGRG